MKYQISLKYFLACCVLLVIFSCGKEENMGKPGKVELVNPSNNGEVQSVEIGDENVTVIFNWNESDNTEEYDLVITKNATGETFSRLDLITNGASRELEVGFEYSWNVTSKNAGDETTTSDIFTFATVERQGPNTAPPFANLVSPSSGASVLPNNGKMTLTWSSASTDADGDILNFTVYADQVDGNQEPPAAWKNITEKKLEIDVESDKTYFWRVETSDGVETVTSETYSFTTDGTSSVTGTIVTNAQELLLAISNASPGENIYVREGNYVFNATIEIENDGSPGNLISLFNHPDDEGRPFIDFSSMPENSSNRGIILEADYWHIKGIDVFDAGDNGLFIRGHNNLIEFCTFSECSDTGLQIGNGGSNNTILNCDSYYNADSSVENADGFACKLDAGEGNKFIGCRAWQNLDDGWDGYLRDIDNITTTYENCWAIRNGILKDGTIGGGDGNGFKTGGSDNKDLSHHAVLSNCLAIGNVVDGFDHNSNRGVVTLYNCSSYDNGTNYNFSNSNPLAQLIAKNCNVLGSLGSINADVLDVTNNSWQNNINVDANDFMSINSDQLLADRKPDGALPDITFFHLNASSDMIDQGVDVGLPFNGSAPDIGAFEF